MINPWTIYFDTFIRELTSQQEKPMKKYEIKFETKATVVVEVDAQDRDQALEYAWDYIDSNDAEFGEWDCVDVSLA